MPGPVIAARIHFYYASPHVSALVYILRKISKLSTYVTHIMYVRVFPARAAQNHSIPQNIPKTGRKRSIKCFVTTICCNFRPVQVVTLRVKSVC